MRHCGLWEGPLRTLANPRAPPKRGTRPDGDEPRSETGPRSRVSLIFRMFLSPARSRRPRVSSRAPPPSGDSTGPTASQSGRTSGGESRLYRTKPAKNATIHPAKPVQASPSLCCLWLDAFGPARHRRGRRGNRQMGEETACRTRSKARKRPESGRNLTKPLKKPHRRAILQARWGLKSLSVILQARWGLKSLSVIAKTSLSLQRKKWDLPSVGLRQTLRLLVLVARLVQPITTGQEPGPSKSREKDRRSLVPRIGSGLSSESYRVR